MVFYWISLCIFVIIIVGAISTYDSGWNPLEMWLGTPPTECGYYRKWYCTTPLEEYMYQEFGIEPRPPFEPFEFDKTRKFRVPTEAELAQSEATNQLIKEAAFISGMTLYISVVIYACVKAYFEAKEEWLSGL